MPPFLYLQLNTHLPTKYQFLIRILDYTYMVDSDSLGPSRIGLAGIECAIRKIEVLFFGQKYFRWNP